jgi:hypothetical protein
MAIWHFSALSLLHSYPSSLVVIATHFGLSDFLDTF